MCSKTSIGNYGDDYSGSCPKKQKSNNNGKRRVPRRGPGVAELEKIRLEEQHISSSAQLPPPQPEKPPSVIHTTTTMRSGPVYPFPSYFTAGSFPSDLIPPAPVFQRNHDSCLHYLAPMNIPNPGFYQFIEPPSNQSSCHDNVSQFSDSQKAILLIVAAKRPWQVMAESTRCDVGPTVTISRNGKQIKPLDQRLRNHFQDSGTTFRNPITIDSPSPPIIPNSSLDFPRFMHYEQKDGFNRESMPQRGVVNASSNRKPFYSFLPANEQRNDDQDLSISLRTEKYDTVTDHGIDLRLKL
ncbi:hypothetical protein HID58_066155 [Brassica napus]|uniref:Uncharacterized protein n=1 Tax=Brassica napus TaxID=3708 RepID=A0ABQ7ZEV2_BRANA|nr:protein SPEAR4-like [Brassica napus]KAH0878761.1 hypothetical protein HID58_066155 [Brassica napus]